mgnify:FL=1|tara:strand:- start:866 stop:1111 length:246 start_codon:yes stop_codon:yes gene_type:complete
MINLDEKYHNYLTHNKTMKIDGVNEKVTGYGYNCDGNDIIGYWVSTVNYKLYYNLNEQFLKMEALQDEMVRIHQTDNNDAS